MNIRVEIDDNFKVEEIKEFELEDIIYTEIQKLRLAIDNEHVDFQDCYNKLNIDKMAIHSKRHSELMRELRLLQLILCKYYNKQIYKNIQ